MEDSTKSIGTFLLVFIAIIVGLAIMSGGIYPEIGGQIEKTYVRNATIDLSLARGEGGNITITPYYFPLAVSNVSAGWRNSYPECAVATVVILNQTNQSLVVSTDYTWTAADGKLVFKDTAVINQTADGNSSIISYIYCGEKYVGGAVNRTLINLIPIFLALAVALIALFPVLKSKILGE